MCSRIAEWLSGHCILSALRVNRRLPMMLIVAALAVLCFAVTGSNAFDTTCAACSYGQSCGNSFNVPAGNYQIFTSASCSSAPITLTSLQLNGNSASSIDLVVCDSSSCANYYSLGGLIGPGKNTPCFSQETGPPSI